MAKPSNAGYLFERLCWLSFAVPMFWTAFVKPGYFGHLTYWTLMVHLVYFCVDKSSPHATASIYLLHGMSFCGAMAVFIGYSFISLGGMYRYGTWIAWENAVGAAAGTVLHDRGFWECAINKTYEHLWPVLAVILDLHFSRDILVKTYTGARKIRTMVLSLGSYLAFGLCWEAYSKATKGEQGSSINVYMQPREFTSASIYAKLGLDATGVPDDFVFVNFQKALLIGFAALMYATFSHLGAAPPRPCAPPLTVGGPSRRYRVWVTPLFTTAKSAGGVAYSPGKKRA